MMSSFLFNFLLSRGRRVFFYMYSTKPFFQGNNFFKVNYGNIFVCWMQLWICWWLIYIYIFKSGFSSRGILYSDFSNSVYSFVLGGFPFNLFNFDNPLLIFMNKASFTNFLFIFMTWHMSLCMSLIFPPLLWKISNTNFWKTF